MYSEFSHTCLWKRTCMTSFVLPITPRDRRPKTKTSIIVVLRPCLHACDVYFILFCIMVIIVVACLLSALSYFTSCIMFIVYYIALCHPCLFCHAYLLSYCICSFMLLPWASCALPLSPSQTMPMLHPPLHLFLSFGKCHFSLLH